MGEITDLIMPVNTACIINKTKTGLASSIALWEFAHEADYIIELDRRLTDFTTCLQKNTSSITILSSPRILEALEIAL